MRHIKSTLLKFYHQTHGSVSILFGMMLVTLLAMMGAAADYSKWTNASSKAGAALDSALLAAGRQMQMEPDSEKALEVAQTYFNQSVAAGIQIEKPVATFKFVDSGSGLEGRVTGKVRTPLLGLISIPTMDIVNTGKVAFNDGGNAGTAVELSLMLDVTGSMCNDNIGPCTASTKMVALKTATKDLLNLVIKDGQDSRAALVPFSTRVRVAASDTPEASTMMKKLTNLDATWSGWQSVCTGGSGSVGSETNGNATCSKYTPMNLSNLKIMPCVVDRTGPNEFTDAPPGNLNWLNAHQGNRSPLREDSGNVPITAGSTLGTGSSAANPTGQWNYVKDGACLDIFPPNVIMPLTNSINDLTNRVDALEAYGSTGGAMGTAWAWYMLSPNWSSIWTGASTPGPYSDLTAIGATGKPKLRKVAVLLTDGDYNTYRGWKAVWPPYIQANTKSICANMKAAGVEVFTVGFDLDALPPANRDMAVDTLKSCGTDISHFYNSIDPDQLKTAFRDIGLKLSKLYLIN